MGTALAGVGPACSPLPNPLTLLGPEECVACEASGPLGHEQVLTLALMPGILQPSLGVELTAGAGTASPASAAKRSAYALPPHTQILPVQAHPPQQPGMWSSHPTPQSHPMATSPLALTSATERISAL